MAMVSSPVSGAYVIDSVAGKTEDGKVNWILLMRIYRVNAKIVKKCPFMIGSYGMILRKEWHDSLLFLEDHFDL